MARDAIGLKPNLRLIMCRMAICNSHTKRGKIVIAADKVRAI